MTRRDRLLFRTMSLTLTAGIALMGIKFLAWYLTRSDAILSDAMESIVNVIAGGVALYSIYFSAKPRDLNHPYGHGKIEFFAAGMEGTLITLAGLIIIIKAFIGFFHPSSVKELSWGLVLILTSSAGNFLLAFYLSRIGKKHHSLTLIADGKHLMTDVYSSLGLAAGLAVIYLTQIYWLDGVLALGFGAFIVREGYLLIRNAVAGLMDETNPELIGKMAEIFNLRRRTNWIDVHNLRVQNYGQHLHLDAHIIFPFFKTVAEVNEEIAHIEKIINEDVAPDVEIFIHAEPCTFHFCRFCQSAECTYRTADFEALRNWTAEKITQNEPYHPVMSI